MTRKDYEMLAAVLKGEFTAAKASLYTVRAYRMSTVSQVARKIAEAIHAENPRFEVDRFLTDCGVTA